MGAGTAGQSTTPGQTTSPGNTNPASGTAAPTPGTAAPTPGTAAPTPGTASPNPGTAPNTNGSTRQLPNGTPGARHNHTGVGNSWGYHPATRATGAQQPSTKVTKPWHEWEPVRGTFEVVESKSTKFSAGSSVVLSNNFGTPAQAAE